MEDLSPWLPEAPPRAPFEHYLEEYGDLAIEKFCEVELGCTYTDDVHDVMRSAVRYRKTVCRSANSVGKTHAGAAIAVAFLCIFPGAEVITLAAPPIGNLETKLWGEIGKLVARRPKLFGSFKLNHLKIEAGPKNGIYGITIPQSGNEAQREASVAGSHAPNQLYLVDEADNVPGPIFKGIESCMTGAGAHLCCFFNPRDEFGHVYELEINGEANVVEMSAFRHPNVVTGENLYPGAVDRDTTVYRINAWTRPLQPGEKIDGECFDVPAFLAGCVALSPGGKPYPPLPAGHRKIEDPRFSYMVLGRYSAKGSQRNIFDKAYLAGLHRKYIEKDAAGQLLHPPSQVITGGDGQLRVNCHIFRQPEEGRRHVIGADVAKGVIKGLDGTEDRDFHTFDVFDVETWEHVAMGWGRDDCTPEQFAGDLAAMGHYFNTALIACEVNNYGRSTLNELVNHHRYPQVYYRKVNKTDQNGKLVETEEWGFETTSITKPIRDGYLQQAIAEAAAGWGKLKLRGPRALQELMNYVHLPGGKAGAKVGHDDHETSISIAVTVMREMPVKRVSDLKPREPEAFYGGGRF